MVGRENIDISILVRLRDHASDAFRRLGAGIARNSQKITRAAKSLAPAMIAVGTASVGALVGSVKAASDFESAFAGVVKTYEAVSGSAEDTERELEQINDRFREMAKEVPVAFTELSRIGELAGQLGVRGVDNMEKFTKTVAQLSVTTNLTSEQAATSFARIANIMQEPLDSIDRMGASVVDLGNNFATTEAEIVDFSNRIAGAGRIAGLSTAEIFGIGTALSSVGVLAQAGGTAVQKALIAMNTAVAKGDENLQLFAETAGLTADTFAEKWETEPAEAFVDFIEGLGDAGDDAAIILEDLGIGNQRLIRAFLSLANAGELTEEAIAKATKAFEENTALVEEAEKRFATTRSQLKLLKNNFLEVAVVLGEALLPIINKFVEVMIPVAEVMADFVEKNPEVTATFLAVGAAIGAVGLAVITLLPLITALTGVGLTVGAAVATLVGIFLGVPAVIAGIVAAGVLLIKNWEKVKDISKDVADFVSENYSDLKDNISETYKRIGGIISDNLDLTLGDWAEFFGLVIGLAETEGKAIANLMNSKLQGIKLDFIIWRREMESEFETFWDNAGETLTENINFFAEEFRRGLDRWKENWRDVLDSMRELVESKLQGWKLGVIDTAISKFNSLKDSINDVIDRFKEGREKGIEGFQTGGVVGGAIGQPQLAIVHGGEEIIPTSKRQPESQRGGGGSQLNLNVHIGLYAGSATEKRRVAEELYQQLVNLAASQNKSVAEYFGG